MPLHNGAQIRQRPATHVTASTSERRDFEMTASQPSTMGTFRAITLCVSLLGVLTFSILAISFRSRYAFFGFHGNMEEASQSCWETVFLFTVTAILSAFPSITSGISRRFKAYTLDKKHKLPGAYRR